MSNSSERDQNGFICDHCKKFVPHTAPGTKHRNHCPSCLWSKHVALEAEQDDRKSQCLGLMKPIGISIRDDGEWALIHRCTKCELIRTNRIAGDDDEVMLLYLALRPLTNLPFPIDSLPMLKNITDRNL
jgi:hypothetical protein